MDNITLDYILSSSIDDNTDIEYTNIDNSTDKKSKKNKKNIESKNSEINNSELKNNKTKKTDTENKNTDNKNTDNNDIDNILNKGLVKFDNKIQTSMFFVCYKAMTTFCNDIKSNHNIIIPNEFIDNHITNILPNIIKEYTGNLKKRSKKIINLDMICLGRKLDCKQCTRKKHNDSEFCKSHFIKLSNGRIDLPMKINVKNKRGRKRKVDFDPRQYDNEYITLWEDIINGEKVLIDINNNIFSFDLINPQYIGKKEIENKLDILSILNEIEKEKELETKKELETNITCIENKIELDLDLLNTTNTTNTIDTTIDTTIATANATATSTATANKKTAKIKLNNKKNNKIL